MRRADKFLLAMVAGIIIIAGAAVVSVVSRANAVAYRPDDRPEGAAFNYLLALQRGDHAQAYAYMSPTIKNYPASVGAFASIIENTYPLDVNRDVALEIDSVRVENDLAWVQVRETTYYRGGPFASHQDTRTFRMTLRRETPGWKITDSDAYWAWSWRTWPY
ncbi:MAG: hypothetical protein U0822_20665 [Anaerolineae bacterium]